MTDLTRWSTRIGLTLSAGLVSGCGTSTDPFTSGSAAALVGGAVTDRHGASLAGTTLRIRCAGGGDVAVVVADSAGEYLAQLATGSDPFDGQSGPLRCTFTEPATGTARVELDATLSFSRGPVFLARQLVDVQER